jgi:hypothetical protein
MKKRKSLSVIVLACLLGGFGISRGLAYVGSTINRYSHTAPCGSVPGFAGLLQAAHFIPIGDCDVEKKGGCVAHGPCTILHPPSGRPTKGRCTDTPPIKRGGPEGCACIADRDE